MRLVSNKALNPIMEDDIRSLGRRLRDRETQRFPCPFCSHERSLRHQKDRCLSLTREANKLLYRCWHCAREGALFEEREPEYKPKPIAIKLDPPMNFPPLDKLPPLKPAHLAWLESRGISAEVAAGAHLYPVRRQFDRDSTEIHDGIAFPYISEGKIYSVKERSIHDKKFLSFGTGRGLFGEEFLGGEEPDRVYIVEGEMDCLALRTAGIGLVVSLPNGTAIGHQDDRSWSALAALVKRGCRFVLAGDSDEVGRKLRAETARRLGRVRCWTVDWPEGVKDANDFLLLFGAEALRNKAEQATPFPVDGLYEASAFTGRIEELWRGERSQGYSTGIPPLEGLYSVPMGTVTLITGWPGDGKSTLLNQILTNLADQHDFKTMFWSPESPPEVHVANLIQLRTQKSFYPGKAYRMALEEAAQAMVWVNDHFYFAVDDEENDPTLDSILDRVEASILRYGVRLVVIDPFNHISKPSGDMNEVDWIRRLMIRLRRFAQNHDVHIFLVAHPKQAPNGFTKSPPTGFHISGGAHWNNITDMGVTVFRPDDVDYSEFIVWKMRFSWHGRKGKAKLDFDADTGRYMTPMIEEDSPLNRVDWSRWDN